ncbi:MAG: AzlC family ABC transporter permease [Bdellovibrionales bacterium]
MNWFKKGFQSMLPILTGVIPFGLVMGTVASTADLSLSQTMSMNVLVFAGAAQFVAVELMQDQALFLIIAFTGCVINLRMILYSAGIAGLLKGKPFWVKLLSAYALTDQSYSVLVANKYGLSDTEDTLKYYAGAGVCMILGWQLSVPLGYYFGNFAPPALSLDFAVPLSFIALVLPSMKSKAHITVAVFSSIVSILLYSLPYGLGLVITALVAMVLGAFLSKARLS